MDLLTLKSLLLLLLLLFSSLGFCVGQQILPEGPVDAVLGTNVTLKTLLNNPRYVFIIWKYSDGVDQTHIAATSSAGLEVNGPYEGRVSVNETNGDLTLGPLKMEDSGHYSIHVTRVGAARQTAEIELRVLALSTRATPTSAPPGATPTSAPPGATPTSPSPGATPTSAPPGATPTSAPPDASEQRSGYFAPLVVCAVVIVVLSAVCLLLLYKWMESRKFRTSSGRKVEVSVARQTNAPGSAGEDATYQSLNPSSRDQNQIYSTLTEENHELHGRRGEPEVWSS